MRCKQSYRNAGFWGFLQALGKVIVFVLLSPSWVMCSRYAHKYSHRPLNMYPLLRFPSPASFPTSLSLLFCSELSKTEARWRRGWGGGILSWKDVTLWWYIVWVSSSLFWVHEFHFNPQYSRADCNLRFLSCYSDGIVVALLQGRKVLPSSYDNGYIQNRIFVCILLSRPVFTPVMVKTFQPTGFAYQSTIKYMDRAKVYISKHRSKYRIQNCHLQLSRVTYNVHSLRSKRVDGWFTM